MDAFLGHLNPEQILILGLVVSAIILVRTNWELWIPTIMILLVASLGIHIIMQIGN